MRPSLPQGGDYYQPLLRLFGSFLKARGKTMPEDQNDLPADDQNPQGSDGGVNGAGGAPDTTPKDGNTQPLTVNPNPSRTTTMNRP